MTILYEVAPRYTPGSPAMVPEVTARKVAMEERSAYLDAVAWSLHPKHSVAVSKGLSWIAWERYELRGRIYKRCLLTNECQEYVAGKPLFRVKTGLLAGALVQVIRQSARTGMCTVRMVSDKDCYTRGTEVHLEQYEVEQL